MSIERGVWEKIGSIRSSLTGNVFAGVALTGGPPAKSDASQPPQATVKWISPTSLSIPLIGLDGKRSSKYDAYLGQVKLTPIVGNDRADIAYTLDGPDPDSNSSRFRRWYLVNVPGEYELCARVIAGAKVCDVVSYRFRVNAE